MISLETHANFRSHLLDRPRQLVVFLPPGYRESRRTYPVLYMQDGQNLFDPSTAFLGQEWRLDDTAHELILRGEIEPLIVVGVYNAGEARIDEYTPSVDKSMGKGGKSYLYGRMLVEEVKPFIDRTYRTRLGTRHTGIGGSSLGALAALEIAYRCPQVYGKVAVHSPSVWWDNRAILRMTREAWFRLRPKIWLDVGTREGNHPERNTRDVRKLRDALVAKGWREGDDLQYLEAEGADHSERAWSERVGPMLRYLYPPA